MEHLGCWDELSCKHCGSNGKREIYCEACGKKRCADCAGKFKVHEGDRYWCDDSCRNRPPPSQLPRNCSIQALNAADPGEVRAKHLIGLKCGRDRWSRLTREQLLGLLDKVTAKRITEGVEGATDQEVAMRWVLRGLGADLAIRKAQLAADIRDAAIRGKGGVHGRDAQQRGPARKFRSGSGVVPARPMENRVEIDK